MKPHNQRYILYSWRDGDTQTPKGWIQQVGSDWYGAGEGAELRRSLVEGRMPFDNPRVVHGELHHCYSGFYSTYDLVPASDITDAEVKISPDGTVHELRGSTTKEKKQ